jgi:TolA-binding protein
MRKTVKLIITCLVMLAVGAVTANLSFAAENATIDFEKLLEENNSESIEQIEEEKPQEQTQTQEQIKTENNNAEENNTKNNEEKKEPETIQEETKTTEDTKTETTDDTKLPQTGITENYIIAFCVIGLGAVAMFAYKKAKNYNIK